MKKILSIAVLLIVGCLSMAMFSGCETRKKEYLVISAPEIFAKASLPNDREAYEQNLTSALSRITIKLCVKDDNGKDIVLESIQGDKAYEEGASFSNFSLKSTGTRTCTVTWKGASGRFVYTV